MSWSLYSRAIGYWQTEETTRDRAKDSLAAVDADRHGLQGSPVIALNLLISLNTRQKYMTRNLTANPNLV